MSLILTNKVNIEAKFLFKYNFKWIIYSFRKKHTTRSVDLNRCFFILTQGQMIVMNHPWKTFMIEKSLHRKRCFSQRLFFLFLFLFVGMEDELKMERHRKEDILSL